jgi:beta-lactamase regulating signal transducer with metallopeptidase domain
MLATRCAALLADVPAHVLSGAAVLVVAWGLWRTGALRRRPAVWAVIWALVAIKWILPWGPQVTGSLADLWSRLWSASALQRELASSSPPAGAHGAEAGAWAAWSVGLVAAWAALSALQVAAAARRIAQQARRLRELRARGRAPAWVEQRCQALAAQLKVAPPVVVMDAEPVVPHLLVGLRGSFVVVPARLLEDAALLELTLAHELAHLRRRDALARWLLAIAAAVWFWLPLRRLIGAPLERSQEAAADALAVRALAITPAEYARRLVDIAARFRQPAMPAAVAVAGSGSLFERVEALCVRGSRAGVGPLGGILVAAFAVLALGRARAPAPSDTERCEYSPALAEALREVHPEADRNGDGELERDEACALEEQLRRAAALGGAPQGQVATAAGPLWQRLCCECETSGSPVGAAPASEVGGGAPLGSVRREATAPPLCEQE